jgi:hypothetical protein
LSLEQHIKIHELAGDDIPLRILRRMYSPLLPKQARLDTPTYFF